MDEDSGKNYQNAMLIKAEDTKDVADEVNSQHHYFSSYTSAQLTNSGSK